MTFAVFLVATPLLLSGLGDRVFGVLQFVTKIGAFGGATNLGATSYLKVALAKLDSSDPRVRLAIGQCLVQWLLFLPFLLACVFALSPKVAGADASGSIQLAVAVLLLLVPVSQVVLVPQVALFSFGYGYVGAGPVYAVAALAVLSGALAVNAGAGLHHYAYLQVLAVVVSGLYLHYRARALIPAYGAKTPDWAAIKSGLLPSGGIALGSIATLGMQQLEVLAVASAMGMVAVGHLVITATPIQILDLVVRQFITASLPLMAVHLAEDQVKASRLRKRSRSSLVAIYAASAPPIIYGTGYFINLWVDGRGFLGALIVAALLCSALCKALLQLDAIILDQLGRVFIRPAVLAIGAASIQVIIAGGGAQSILIVVAVVLAVLLLNVLAVSMAVRKVLGSKLLQDSLWVVAFNASILAIGAGAAGLLPGNLALLVLLLHVCMLTVLVRRAGLVAELRHLLARRLER